MEDVDAQAAQLQEEKRKKAEEEQRRRREGELLEQAAKEQRTALHALVQQRQANVRTDDEAPLVESENEPPPPPPPPRRDLPLLRPTLTSGLSSTNDGDEKGKEKEKKKETDDQAGATDTCGETHLPASSAASTSATTVLTERISSPFQMDGTDRASTAVNENGTSYSAAPPPPPRRRRLLLDDEDGDLSPQTTKILLLMENLLVLINVWRDSELGQKILQERGISISAAERDDMDGQLNKLKPQMRRLERCIVNLFTTFKNGQDINAKQLLAILDDIKKSEDPSSKRFFNTIQNLLNDMPAANIICLPAALFRQSVSADHTIANIIYNLRRHIIYKHKFYFEKYDLSILGKASPNTSAQRASYNIQAELATYIKDRAKLERKCSQLGRDQECVQELVKQIIAKHLGIAGTIPVWFKEDSYFAKTLDIIATFNKPIDDKSKNSSFEKLFLHNPLSAFNTTIVNGQRANRNAKQTRHALTVILLMFANYYLNTPLGKFYAERFGIDENTDFGQKDKIKKLKQLAERLAFDPQNDEDAIKLLIKEIKSVIKSIWSVNSRTLNELVPLVQYFGSEQDKKDLPILVPTQHRKRFCQTKDIFNYDIKQDNIDEFYKLHFTQELTKRLSYYHTVTSKRTRVTTANFKDQAMWQLEQVFADIYNTSVVDEEGLRAKIDNLPAGYDRDLTGLIQYELHRIYKSAICRRAIAEQGEFSIAWHKLNVYFERMIAGKMPKKQQDGLQQQLAVPREDGEASAAPANLAAISVVSESNPDFYVLAARLLAIVNAYNCTDLAVEMNLDLNYDGEGQKLVAETLANYAVQLFLQIKQNERNREVQEESAKRDLIENIKQFSLLIKGNWLAGSPNSRFAKSLDELINSPVNQQAKSLPFNAEKSKKLFPDNNKTDAKRMIHRHVIEQVCTHYVNFEQNILGTYSEKPGDFQQRAVVATRQQLKTYSSMLLENQEIEINKLGQGATIYDLVVHSIAKPIVTCGKLNHCFMVVPFSSTLNAACTTLSCYLPVDGNSQSLVKMLVPKQVERCLPDAILGDAHDLPLNMYRLLGSVHIICKYYLDDNLGRQYADANGFPYHKKHGWDEQVRQLFILAKHLYVRKNNVGENDQDFVKNNMAQLLCHMTSLIDTIRNSFSNNSALANELITLVTRYGPYCQITTEHNLTNTRYKEDEYLVDSRRLSRDKAEDFMQMSLIQEAASELVQLKDDLDGAYSEPQERAGILQMEQNLDKLYKMTIEDRRAEMTRLLPEGQRNISNLIKKYIPINVPYDFMSPNSYLKNAITNKPLKRIYKYLDYLQAPVVSAVNEVIRLVPVQ